MRLFHLEGRSLVRLARIFVDDRDAAEDIVQEAFLRLARHAGRIHDESKAPAYLRSIVLNLARDHNRRGLLSCFAITHLPATTSTSTPTPSTRSWCATRPTVPCSRRSAACAAGATA